MTIKPVGDDYLQRAAPRPGQMDHDNYAWRDTWASERLVWPEGIRLGIWLQLAIEWFPLDIAASPFLPVGAPSRPWPDTQTYTQRDYGNRIGIYRLLDALQERGVSASAFLNARVAERYPLLLGHLLDDGLEIVAAGLDAGALHHEGLSEAEERAMIAEALALFSARGVSPVAWHSPSWSQSTRTPQLLREAGVLAMADWGNDEAPYRFATAAGSILSLPSSYELSDRELLANRHYRLDELLDAFMGAAQRLLYEAEDSGHGRLLTLNLSPWLMGQPYRIAAFEQLLDQLFALPGTASVGVPQIIAASRDR